MGIPISGKILRWCLTQVKCERKVLVKISDIKKHYSFGNTLELHLFHINPWKSPRIAVFKKKKFKQLSTVTCQELLTCNIQKILILQREVFGKSTPPLLEPWMRWLVDTYLDVFSPVAPGVNSVRNLSFSQGLTVESLSNSLLHTILGPRKIFVVNDIVEKIHTGTGVSASGLEICLSCTKQLISHKCI